MRTVPELVGKRFGHLAVLARCEKPSHLSVRNHTQAFWLCRCDCDRETIVPSHRLTAGLTKSCNCSFSDDWCITHGLAYSREYIMWNAAKGRAKKLGLPFDLCPKDIVIPAVCPVLGIPLFSNVGKLGSTPNSPTVDRIIPVKGYTQGNIQVISHRANTIKSDATAEELMQVAQHMAGRNV